MKSVPILAAALLALSPAAALAHPKLVSSSPAANAVAASPGRVTLRFSERLVPRVASATLTMTGMPGMADHPPMPVTARTTVGGDGRTLLVTPNQRLVAGTYRVNYRVVGADTHPIQGAYTFRVR